MRVARKWEQPEIDLLCQKELSISAISIMTNRTYKSVSRKREELRLVRPKVDWGINDNFFKKWSPTMSYILGFWFADGNMFHDKQNNTHYISISSKDGDHLTEMIKVMGSQHQPYFNKKEKMFWMRFGSQPMYMDLLSLGGSPNKSLILQFPKLPTARIHDFLLGYFDGDGSISLKSNGYPNVGFVGTKEFLEEISSNFSDQHYRLIKHNPTTTTNTWRLNFCGTRALEVMTQLYSSKTKLFLRRKYDRFLSAKRWYKNG
jgi:hypothetical protein